MIDRRASQLTGKWQRRSRAAQSLGLIMIRAGLHDNVVRLLPPLVTTNQQLDDGPDILTEVLADVSRRSA